ncbi:MAG: hypothetical protein JSS43_16855 [Proteobacteria bacterium]|nr:hypothetical protein [Pseudomonadota bacterium]
MPETGIQRLWLEEQMEQPYGAIMEIEKEKKKQKKEQEKMKKTAKPSLKKPKRPRSLTANHRS